MKNGKTNSSRLRSGMITAIMKRTLRLADICLIGSFIVSLHTNDDTQKNNYTPMQQQQKTKENQTKMQSILKLNEE